MVIYLYDGSFEGLMTAINHALENNIEPDRIVRKNSYNNSLFSKPVYIKTDQELSLKLSTELKIRLGQRALKEIYYSFLSEKPNVEKIYTTILNLVLLKGRIFIMS